MHPSSRLLTPRRQVRPLMPQDRQIMALLELDAATYRRFLEQADRMARVQAARGEPQAFLFGLGAAASWAIINLAVGVALTAASALLRPQQQSGGEAPRIENKQVDGKSLANQGRYGPKSGFGSVQSVVELGSIVPLVYAKRETIDGVTYGGVRVNADLLWSQMLSLGGNQFFRGVYLIGQGGIEEVDVKQFAMGDNLLSAYGITNTVGDQHSRLSAYMRLNGGRLTAADFVAGRIPSLDPGNFDDSDIYLIPGASGLEANHSAVVQPSNQRQFGVYAPIGCALSYRANPRFRPARTARLKPKDNRDKYEVDCVRDVQVEAEREKYKASFHSRVLWDRGTTDVAFTLNPGDEPVLTLAKESDGQGQFIRTKQQSGPDPEGIAELQDVAQSIAARQASYDQSIEVGGLYLLGTALAVCTSRTDAPFLSDVSTEPYGNGQSVTATFRVIEGGQCNAVDSYNQSGDVAGERGIQVASRRFQVARVAVASLVMGQAAQTIEIGIRSTLGIRISGLANFSDVPTVANEVDGGIDYEACQKFSNEIVKGSDQLPTRIYQNGSLNVDEERYSFWRLRYRIAGTDDPFTTTDILIGTRGIGQQPIYNYIRIQFPAWAPYELQSVPVMGCAVRSGTEPLWVIDHKMPATTVSTSGLELTFNGEQVTRNTDTFGIKLFRNDRDLEMNSVDNDFVDDYAKLAEVFIYDAVTSSAQSAPEHEIAYVNIFTDNESAPQYDNLAIAGMNIAAGPELSSLSQLSAYVTKGLKGTHLFPEVYADMLTNPEYQARGVLSSRQIDEDSFQESANFNLNRRYFCDIGQAEPINRRTWGQEVANNHLLDLVTRNGKVVLQPSFYFDQKEPITALFTAGNIIEDSFEIATVDVADRQPVRLSVRYRDERSYGSLNQRGLFPVVREVTVARKGTPANARLVRLDLSDYCTSRRHAIDVGKYRCLVPVLQPRTARFRTWPQAGTVIPGRCFQVGMEAVTYEAPANGVIGLDGTVTAWPPLADGTYQALVWVPGPGPVEERSLTISGGKASPAGAVFCLPTTSAKTLTFKATSIQLNEDAEVEVEGIEFPLTSSGLSQFADGFDDDANWEIEGAPL